MTVINTQDATYFRLIIYFYRYTIYNFQDAFSSKLVPVLLDDWSTEAWRDLQLK